MNLRACLSEVHTGMSLLSIASAPFDDAIVILRMGVSSPFPRLRLDMLPRRLESQALRK